MELTTALLFIALSLIDVSNAASKEIDIVQAPYEATVEYKENKNTPNEFKCNAVIYNPEWVITSATCLENLKQNHILIRSGSKEYLQKGGLHVVKKIIKHPQFNDETTNNIALIRLHDKNPFKFSLTVSNIPLAQDALQSEVSANVVGWSIDRNAQKGDKLQTADVKSTEISNCRKAFGEDLKIGTLCSTQATADEAAPLVAKAELQGLYIKSAGSYNFYADISYYRPWIHETIQKN